MVEDNENFSDKSDMSLPALETEMLEMNNSMESPPKLDVKPAPNVPSLPMAIVEVLFDLAWTKA